MHTASSYSFLLSSTFRGFLVLFAIMLRQALKIWYELWLPSIQAQRNPIQVQTCHEREMFDGIDERFLQNIYTEDLKKVVYHY